MRILVTGGAGFIGSHLVRRLVVQSGHEVVNLDALKYSGNLENLKAIETHVRHTFVHGDIGDQPLVERLLREHRIEGVINAAAETHVDRSILDPGALHEPMWWGPACCLRRPVVPACSDFCKSARTKSTAVSRPGCRARPIAWLRAVPILPAKPVETSWPSAIGRPIGSP